MYLTVKYRREVEYFTQVVLFRTAAVASDLTFLRIFELGSHCLFPSISQQDLLVFFLPSLSLVFIFQNSKIKRPSPTRATTPVLQCCVQP
jgi:hypothetical protein